MELSALITLLGGVALAVNRIVEIGKPAFEQLPDPYKGIALRVTSILLGVIITLGGGEAFNLLALSPVYGRLNPNIGLVITGVIVGGFANGWDAIASLFNRPDVSTSSVKSVTVASSTQHTERE